VDSPAAMARSTEMLALDSSTIGENNKVRFYPLVADHAAGATITDVDGRDYVDFTAGWAVANTGYSHPRVVEAITAQVASLSFASYATVPHRAALDAAQRLLDVTPGRGDRKVAFGLTGSDAVEGVCKLLPFATGKPKIIAFLGGMHGMSATSAGVSSHPAVARFPTATNVVRVPYPYPYRPALGGSEDCGREAVRFIEEQILTTVAPPEITCGILVEPVQSDGGVVVPPDDFLPALRTLCDKHGLHLIVDEVKVGVGRTGRPWGCQVTNTTPDVLITGKALGSGVPISAVVAPAEVLDAMPAGHAFTTAGAPIPCAAAAATLQVLVEDGLADRAAATGSFLLQELRAMQERHPLMGDVRGRGLIIGVELVKDPVSKEAASVETAKLALRCFQLGLLIHYVGVRSNVVEITPPLVLSQDEAERGVGLFEQALSDVEDGRVSDDEVAAYAGW